jgi:hypothetical protein
MDDTLVLNNKNLATFGNAILLGYAIDFLNDEVGFDASRTKQSSASRDGLSYYEMLDALQAADLLDDHLHKTLTPVLSSLVSLQDRETVIQGLHKSQAGWARMQFGHFSLSEPVLHKAQLLDALKEIEADAVREPISMLVSSDWRTRLRSFVFSQLVAKALSDLRISAAEYTLIGLEGLALRRLQSKPPKWNDWNSPRARDVRRQNGFENEFLQRANRHILPPVLKLMSDPAASESNVDLAYWVTLNWDAMTQQEIPISMTLSELGGEIHERAHPEYQRSLQLFESYGALSHGNFEVMGDPRNFLMFAWEQIGLIAIKRGWALCFALDGLNDQIVGWVNPKCFDSFALENALQPPSILSVMRLGDLGRHISKISGADRLRFIITSDLADFGDAQDASASSSKTLRSPSRSKSTGFTTSDEPYVEEGLAMLLSGEATSALAAANRLVDCYGEILERDWKPGFQEIRTRSIGQTHARLQKKISNRRKPHLR